MAKKTPPTRIVELEVHRSKRHPVLGYVIAKLFPCGHKKKLGITKFDPSVKENFYRTQCAKIIKIDFVEVTDKEYCRSCPEFESWLGDEPLIQEVLEHIDLVEEID